MDRCEHYQVFDDERLEKMLDNWFEWRLRKYGVVYWDELSAKIDELTGLKTIDETWTLS